MVINHSPFVCYSLVINSIKDKVSFLFPKINKRITSIGISIFFERICTNLYNSKIEKTLENTGFVSIFKGFTFGCGGGI